MITAPTPMTSRPHARGSRDRAIAATIAPRTWDIPAPDLTGLHLDETDNHPGKRAADAAMAVCVLVLAAGVLWLAIPHMTPPFIFTWSVMVAVYLAGRISWDMIRRV